MAKFYELGTIKTLKQTTVVANVPHKLRDDYKLLVYNLIDLSPKFFAINITWAILLSRSMRGREFGQVSFVWNTCCQTGCAWHLCKGILRAVSSRYTRNRCAPLRWNWNIYDLNYMVSCFFLCFAITVTWTRIAIDSMKISWNCFLLNRNINM